MKKKSVIISYLIIFIYVLIAINFGCIYRKLFNLPCPGCGLTRAYISLFKLDIKSAFYYHPLWWTIPILVINAIFNTKYEKIILIITFILFIIVYLIRVITNTLV